MKYIFYYRLDLGLQESHSIAHIPVCHTLFYLPSPLHHMVQAHQLSNYSCHVMIKVHIAFGLMSLCSSTAFRILHYMEPSPILGSCVCSFPSLNYPSKFLNMHYEFGGVSLDLRLYIAFYVVRPGYHQRRRKHIETNCHSYHIL